MIAPWATSHPAETRLDVIVAWSCAVILFGVLVVVLSPMIALSAILNRRVRP